MANAFKSIALIARKNRPELGEILATLITFLQQQHINVVVEQQPMRGTSYKKALLFTRLSSSAGCCCCQKSSFLPAEISAGLRMARFTTFGSFERKPLSFRKSWIKRLNFYRSVRNFFVYLTSLNSQLQILPKFARFSSIFMAYGLK